MKRGLILSCMAVFVFTILCLPAGAVIRVPDDQPNIGAAITAAASGEEIWVANTHVDTTDPIVPANNVSIISYDPSFTTPTPGAQAIRVDIGLGGTYTIDGLHITSADPFSPIAVYGNPVNLTLENCEFTGFAHCFFLTAGGGSIAGSNITVRNCYGHDQPLDIVNYWSGGPVNFVVEDSVFERYNGWGFALGDRGNNGCSFTLTNVDIRDVDGRLFFADLCGTYTFDNVHIDNTGQAWEEPLVWLGWWAGTREGGAVSTFNISNSTLENGNHFGFLSDADNAVINLSDVVIRNTGFEGFCAWPGTGGTQLSMTDVDISEQGSTGTNGAGIWIASALSLTMNRVNIHDGIANDADGMFFPGEANGAQLTMTDCSISGSGRNGFNTDAWINQDANGNPGAKITNCSFNGNGVGVGGNGFSTNIFADNSSYVFNNCTFNENQADGCLPFRAADMSFSNCEFVGNGWGGFTRIVNSGDSSIGSRISMAGCQFEGNGSPAFLVADSSATVDLYACEFIDNGLLRSRASMDLIGNSTGTLTGQVRRCVFQAPVGTEDPVVWLSGFGTDSGVGNYSTGILANCVIDGGSMGIHIDGGAVTVANNTIVGSNPTSTTGVEVFSGTHTLSSNIIDSYPLGLVVYATAEMKNQDYNLINGTIVGATHGVNGLAGDPKFLAPATGAPGTGFYMIQADSPAESAADPALAGLVVDDILGFTRPAIRDIGAYEYFTPASSVGSWELYE